MLTHIDHVGIACRDLEEKIDFYCATFGLTVASREINEEQGVREAMLLVATASEAAGLQAGAPDLRAAVGGGPAPHPGPDLRATAGAGAGREANPGPQAGAGPAGPLLASYVQLLEPLGPDSPVGKFLARRGEGIHHVGYGVADVRAALAAISATGIRLIDERPRHGSMGASIAFLHPADVGGVLTELVEHPAESGPGTA
jgi:methylmalonyl-CoA/ethylmalonyl-CoA epimerase